MTAHLPSRLTQFLFIAILSLLLPETMLAGPGGGGPGGGGHGGGGGHAGGGHSGGGHSASGSGGHVVGAAGGHTSGAPVSGSRGSAAHGNNGAYNGGAEHSEANISGGHSGVFTAPDGNFGRDAATEASLAQMAGHGWNFLPSSGVRPAAQPSGTPARAANFTAHPAFLPPRPYGRGPYIYGIFPYGSLYGVPGFGFGLAGNCFNGFTSFCSPGGYGFYGGSCAGFGSPFCGPYGPGWGWGGAGWGGFVGYAPIEDLGNAPNYVDTPTNESYDNGQDADTGGNYSDMPPEIPPVADASPSAASSQAAVAAPSAPAQLIFKSGSAYAVTAYWVSGTELYYRPVYGGTNHVPLDQLDLPATVEANTRAGVPFTLSARPPQQ